MKGSARDLSVRKHPSNRKFGEWLSLVEHLVRDQGVGGSNPLSPTISYVESIASRRIDDCR